CNDNLPSAVEFADVNARDTGGMGWQVITRSIFCEDGDLAAVIAEHSFFFAVAVDIQAGDLGHFVGHRAGPQLIGGCPVERVGPHAAVFSADNELASRGFAVQLHFAHFTDGLTK